MTAFRTLTAGECASVASLLERAVSRFGIRVSAGSDLGRMISEVGWLGAFAEDSPQPETGWRIDKDRTARAFLLVEQAGRLARALTYASDCRGIRTKTRVLKDRLNRLVSLREQAQDAILELEIAGRLVIAGLAVEFREPDLVVKVPGTDLEIAIACKRPRGVPRIRERILDAGRQIRNSHLPGIVLIGTEPAFHGRAAGVRHFKSTTLEALRRDADQTADLILRTSTREIGHVFDSAPVLGVHFCGIVTGWTSEPSAYSYAWIRRTLPRLDMPGAARLMNQFDEWLFPETQIAA